MSTAATSQQMRRVIVSTDHVASVTSAVTPAPQAGEVLVQSMLVGVCGSDTHAQHGRHPFISLPYAPGHEVVGRVVESPNGGSGLQPGQRVVVEPTLPCWGCKQCLAGRQNLCENLRFFGCVHDQGGMADFFTVPADRLHPVPDDFTDDQAVLIEPLSTPVHAVRLAGPVAGRAVVVLGGGTIGLMTLTAALHQGAAKVVVTDVLDSKRQRALDLGAHAVVDASRRDVVGAVREALGESADVVFDCVAIQSTLTAAVDMVLKGGTVVVVGVPTTDVSLPMAIIQDQQVRVQGSATYLPEDYEESIAIIRAGGVRPEDFITARYAVEDVADAFDASSSGHHLKVLVTVNE
jgi:2-desacetyl-2-hydroxyethyl bacteriochlorophyllide A dehydrogenase